MRTLHLIILLSIFLSSCYTQKRAIRELNRIKIHHPQLIQELSDTIIQVKEFQKEIPRLGDTLHGEWGWDWTNQDTFFKTIQDTILKTEIQLIKDTIIKVNVRTEVFPDTIEVTIKDTIETIVTKTEYVTAVEKKTPWSSKLLIGLLGVGLLLLIIFLFRRNKKE